MNFDLERALLPYDMDAREGLTSLGVQVFVAVGDKVVVDTSFGIDGIGLPMAPHTKHRVYCAGKPLGALAIGRLVELGELSWDDQFSDLIDQPMPATIGTITVEQALRHQGGLVRPRGRDMIMMPTELRTEMVKNVGVAPGLVHMSAYSEFAGWHLLGLAIRDLTGERTADFIRREILEPLGLEDELRIGVSSRAEMTSVPNVDLTELQPVPMLLSSTYEACHHGEIADQAIATARGLGKLYMQLGRILDQGGSPEASTVAPLQRATLERMLQPSPTAFDPSMARDCSYGSGFMTKLSEHLFGNLCSDRSFGHSGFKGVTFGFHDPETRVSMAVHENAVLDVETSLSFRRARRVDALLRALGAELSAQGDFGAR